VLKFLSWNVNGARAAAKKGALDWLLLQDAAICALQETKARREQLPPEIAAPPGWFAYWNAAERPGYSGTAVFAREEPLSVRYGFGEPEFDGEGRMTALEYPRFHFLNFYFPNGGSGPERLDFKLRFYAKFLEHAGGLLASGKTVIVCGDVNTAHTELDLARPKENEAVSGFLPQERQWLDKFFAAGFADTFRVFNKDGGHYTWWDMKTRARERNSGWRLDYFLIDKPSLPKLKDAFILADAQGSDHCPVGITMDL